MLEKEMRKCKRVQETTGFFPVVSVVWHPPLIHVVARTKRYATSHVTKTMGAPKQSLFTNSGMEGLTPCIPCSFRASTILGKLQKAPRSPSPPRCCQSPRVTSLQSSLDLAPHQDGCTQDTQTSLDAQGMDEVCGRRQLSWFLKCMLESQEHRNVVGGEVYIASKKIQPLEKKAFRKYTESESPKHQVGQSDPLGFEMRFNPDLNSFFFLASPLNILTCFELI